MSPCSEQMGLLVQVKDATCLLTNAPDVVDAKQLEDLSIRITESEQE